MPESASAKYMVRDPQGNVYGPADIALLRAWIGEGRIIAGMHIAPRETREWVEVSQHPELADLFRPQAKPPASVTPVVQPTPTPDSIAQPTRPAANSPAYSPAPFDVAAQEKRVQPAFPQATAQPVPYMGTTTKPHAMALWSMITGIVGVVFALGGCVPMCGCIVGPLGAGAGVGAVLMGVLALNHIREKPDLGGKGQAITAIMLGGVALVGFVCAIVVQYFLFSKH